MFDIIIPAYNCTKTLDRTLASLVAQIDKNFKVTIVDDCSTEPLKPIIKKYRGQLDINHIRNPKNLGCGMSRQVGIDNTYCDFFTFLDADDVFMPYTAEVFNNIIEHKPYIKFLQSQFYQQEGEGIPLKLVERGMTYCHGKLYNREAIEYYGIKNSPLVKWHDDSFFNSMCLELLPLEILDMPMMIWTYNGESVTHKKDAERDRLTPLDFLTAMKISKDFVLQYKDVVNHLPKTLEIFKKQHQGYSFNEEEQALLEYLSVNTKSKI